MSLFLGILVCYVKSSAQSLTLEVAEQARKYTLENNIIICFGTWRV